MPAGKLEKDEEIIGAMIREMREETGLALNPASLEYLTKVFVNHGYDFVYHMFRTKFEAEPLVVVSPKEHQAFLWVTPEEALRMNLVDDLGECVKMFNR